MVQAMVVLVAIPNSVLRANSLEFRLDSNGVNPPLKQDVMRTRLAFISARVERMSLLISLGSLMMFFRLLVSLTEKQENKIYESTQILSQEIFSLSLIIERISVE